MAVDKNTPEVPEVPGAPGGEDPPDWSTWLRSRLERVVTSEREVTDSSSEGPASTARSEPAAITTAPQSPPAQAPTSAASGGDPALASLAGQVDALVEATAACRALIEEQGAISQRLAGWMQELATTQADDERWAVAVGRVVDEVDEERRVAGERVEATLATLAAQMERIEEGLGQMSSEIAGLRDGLSRRVTTIPVKLGEPQLQAVAASIATAVATRSARPGASAGAESAPGRVTGEQPHDGAEPPPRRPRRSAPLRAGPLPPVGHTTRDG